MNTEIMLILIMYSQNLKTKPFSPCFLQKRISVFAPGRLSPTHSCLEDGSHVTGHCPVSPISQAPVSQCKGTPPKQAVEGGNSQSPHRPLLCDMEGNRRERPEYGNKKSKEYSSLQHPFSDMKVSDMNIIELWL